MLARALRLAPLAAALSLPLGCSAAGPSAHDEGEGSPGEPTATTSEAITSNDAVSRGMEWVTAKLQYCQSANGQPDYDTACSSVCNRESNPQWDPYRSDCSGFVSWAWDLPAPGRVTSQFAPFDTTVSKTIQASDLQPGDACNRNSGGHMVLFEKWITPGKQAVFMEEPGCSASEPYAHEFTSDVTVSGVDIDIAYEGTTFTAIRFDQMTASPPPDAGTPADAGSGDASRADAGTGTGGGTAHDGGTGGSSGSGSGGGSGSSSGSSADQDAGASATNGASTGGGTGDPGTLQWNDAAGSGAGCDVGAAPARDGGLAATMGLMGLALVVRRRKDRTGRERRRP